jgi:hypothetical protein
MMLFETPTKQTTSGTYLFELLNRFPRWQEWFTHESCPLLFKERFAILYFYVDKSLERYAEVHKMSTEEARRIYRIGILRLSQSQDHYKSWTNNKVCPVYNLYQKGFIFKPLYEHPISSGLFSALLKMNCICIFDVLRVRKNNPFLRGLRKPVKIELQQLLEHAQKK